MPSALTADRVRGDVVLSRAGLQPPARIHFDQHVPRMGSELGPAGWFSA